MFPDDPQMVSGTTTMRNPEYFRRAPITEAIIDLKATLPPGVTIDRIAEIAPAIAEHYPEKQTLLVGQFELQIGEKPFADAVQQHAGFRFVSGDKREILQARLDGFTFSVLAPYEGWEAFQEEAMRLWNLYRSLVQPEAITRLAVRYINRLDIPAPAIELRDYLRTFPEISSDLPQGLDAYFMQLQIPSPVIPGKIIINQTVVPPPRSDMVSLILDIDIFREENIPQEEDSIWECFEQLRHHKNSIFKACITERTKDLIV